MQKLNSYKIDEQLQPILRQMEKTGIYVDFKLLAKLSEKAGLKLEEIKSQAFKDVGHEYNLDSPSQLAELLYKELKIEPKNFGIKKGKNHYSTSAESLEKLKNIHPVVRLILEYRELAKLKNTYLDPLPKLIGADGRIHTSFAPDTATGRLSSKNPNLQNIPVKNELGREVRKAFVAEKGYKLLAADYSQIELRIAAHFSADPIMIKVFEKNGDIHRITAEQLGVDRRTAKIVNFSILYGVSAYGLAASVGIPVEEAQLLIDKYFIAFPKLKQYVDYIIKDAKEKGYVKTLMGRKRELPEMRSPIFSVRNFGERAAVNTPFQGTAADIIKLAMIKIANCISHIANRKNDKPLAISAKLILQVHDELVFEVKTDQVESVAKIIKQEMEQVYKLKVPLIVDLKIGDNWGEMEELRV